MDIRPVRFQREALEEIVKRAERPGSTMEIDWGSPDSEGFYTPLIWERQDPNHRESWPLGWYFAAFLAAGFLLVGIVLTLAKGWPF